MDTGHDKIAERMRAVIDAKLDKRGKFSQLETLTGISSENWKSFYHARQRANEHMIETMGQLWPEYAFWLVTGIEDFDHGHIKPLDSAQAHTAKRQVRTFARELFLKEIELRNFLNRPEPALDDFDATEGEMLIQELTQLSELRDEQEASIRRISEQNRREQFTARSRRPVQTPLADIPQIKKPT